MTIVYAHRGAAAEQPENTLPSFRRALELGADALETDVHLTADGVIVAAHDTDAERVTGVKRLLRASTRDEIQGWDAGYALVNERGERPFVGRGYRIPTLEELLVELPKVRLNVDLKSEEPALVDHFIALVRRHQAEDRVVAASFFRSTLVHLRAKGWRGETSLAQREFIAAWLVPRVLYGRRAPGTRAQIPTHVGPWSLANRRTLKKLRGLGLSVDFWTINDPDEARALVELGVDGVMTDDPARIVPAVRSAGG
jgi:glycerophosphoryl diester phosphodiesterase